MTELQLPEAKESKTGGSESVRRRVLLLLGCIFVNLENGSDGAAVVLAAAAALVVEKGDFSDTLLEKGEKAGDSEVICEMTGPSSVAAMVAALAVVEKVDISDTLLDKGEKAGDGEMEGPSSVAAMATVVVVVEEEGGGELRVTLFGEGSEQSGERDFLFRETVLFMMLHFSPEKVAEGWWWTAEEL
ncbi:hypothetical protein K7X08_010747 [Anisodus acutangulus]|uniref:Uncharacterized protein n=1 Tax=Anisodus acutangulus TaxID=402998 RepID=A0A9Q1RAH4_9SOLA|nr:hypothetical protein K7X08_010747 [Anisodus acutangulus]